MELLLSKRDQLGKGMYEKRNSSPLPHSFHIPVSSYFSLSAPATNGIVNGVSSRGGDRNEARSEERAACGRPSAHPTKNKFHIPLPLIYEAQHHPSAVVYIYIS